jgi:hypothetical protein
VCIVCVLTAGCQSGGPPVGDSPPDDGTNGGTDSSDATEQAIMNAADLDAWLEAVAARSAYYQASRTTYSSELIGEAYRDGQISEEEYYVLRLTAMFDHDSLEDPYCAEQDPLPSATSLLREIDARYEDFSAETQERLRPYVVPLDDPESFWYRPDEVTWIAGAASEKTDLPLRQMERPTASGDYFDVSGGAGLDEAVAIVRDALETAYDAFVDLGFPEPTDWIAVKVRTDIGSSTAFGTQAFHMLDGRRRCVLLIKSGQSDDNLRGTAVHELFHCFQEYVEADTTPARPGWLWDSSAVWAEEYVYPDANTEHTYDTVFFSSLEVYLFDTDGTRHYASYPFWFFIYQRDGKTGDAVRDLYLEIHEEGTMEAISQRPDFYAEFKEYALWNLNADPHKYYEDAGDEPTLRPFNGSIQYRRMGAGETFPEAVILQAGAIMYYAYTFDDFVDKVRFDLRAVQKDEDNENGIQAVYRIGGEWFYEDVSYHDELTFCRSRASEDVEGVILIVSNGKMDESPRGSLVSEDLTIDTTELCVPGWHGYVECSWSTSGDGDVLGDDTFVLGTYTSHGTTRVDETLLSDGDKVFYATEQTVSISSRYEWFYEHEVPTVDTSYTAWERRVEEKNATRTYIFEPEPECPPDNCIGLPRRIYTAADGAGTFYFLNDQYFQDVSVYLSVYSAYHVPGSLGLMQGHVPEVRTEEDEHDVNVHCPPDPLELTLSTDSRTLSGSYQTETMTCEALYTFD